MDEIRKILTQKVSEWEAILELVEDSLDAAAGLPQERIRHATKKGKILFYLCNRGQKEIRKYIPEIDQRMVPKIIQRDYDRSLKKVLEEQLAAVRRFLKAYNPDKIADKYRKLSGIRKDLLDPRFETNEMFAEKWLQETYQKKSVEGDTVFQTERGELVRSKSEKILADKFASLGIPYKYECPLTLPGGIILHPDFTLLNVRIRQIFIWEHLGMMDDPDYCQTALTRINLYEKAGYFPGRKLLITHETKKTPLDMRVVEKIIEEFLL